MEKTVHPDDKRHEHQNTDLHITGHQNAYRERLEWQAGELPEERDSEENWPGRGDLTVHPDDKRQEHQNTDLHITGHHNAYRKKAQQADAHLHKSKIHLAGVCSHQRFCHEKIQKGSRNDSDSARHYDVMAVLLPRTAPYCRK